MSKLLINNYYQEVEKVKRFGGSDNESVISQPFAMLLNGYCQSRNFVLIQQLPYKTTNLKPDGTIKDALRLDWGYWESKDSKENLEQEIEAKFKKGYPTDNILFEDSLTAILIQNGQEVRRISISNSEDLDSIINQFLDYERPEVKDFREAISSFKQDLPTILTTLRNLINEMVGSAHPTNITQGRVGNAHLPQNSDFSRELSTFLNICQESINPEISVEDVREMMIQHILTEDIFINIFNEGQFHQENNISKSLRRVLDTFFTGNIKRNTLKTINNYYSVIIRTASNIVNHHEKQKFLKVVYEEFYKAYNPLAADKLGIVYTPDEIVKFMIESTDFLLHKHFNKLLGDENIEILDPATGTGTFITEIIEYLPSNNLRYKYQNEIHCNEVSILPYYIANLNIEYTFQQKMGEYLEFENICLMDTLDNTIFSEKQMDLFAMTKENTERIKRQNERKISVIIGNPPYNAKQENYNQNNANRGYQNIDKRIKDTYIKQGSAQNQIVLYDMYVRFIRWATDRLNDNGIIAFITNSSFIDARSFDGLRKCFQEEFNYIYLLDLGGNVRQISGKDGIYICEKHTIFGQAAMTGISICFLIKDSKAKGNQIFYLHPFDIHELREVKLNYLAQTKFKDIPFQHIIPDQKNNWINQVDNDFEELLPLIDKNVKSGKSEKAIFKLFSSGLKTQRDEWVYDISEENLRQKVQFLIDIYQKTLKNANFQDQNKIKWDAELTSYLKRNIQKEFNQEQIFLSLYRPFTKKYLYFDKHFNGRTYQWFNMNQKNQENLIIVFSGIAHNQPFSSLATNTIADLGCIQVCQCISLYSYDEEGNRIENITNWALSEFREYYKNINENVGQASCLSKQQQVNRQDACSTNISKKDIFYYIYGVLHNPKYREKYELNLKRDFPRIPLYNDFWKWKNWGEKLAKLHINYETITPYELNRVDSTGKMPVPRVKLKVDKTKGQIVIDENTILTEIPAIVWEYKLGNRSAIEWILDQYKEKKIKDETISENFNNYRFSDYKETLINLIQKVITVSIETMNIIQEMAIND